MKHILFALFFMGLVQSSNQQLSKRWDNGKRAKLEYQMTKIDYDWPSETTRQDFINNKSYIAVNNIISAIKVWRRKIFITVPRWRPGVPASLNRLVSKYGRGQSKPVLRPFPSWKANKIGDCSALQYIQSMEIDPNTNYMWVIDAGRLDIFTDNPRNLCPAKIVIYDLQTEREVDRYIFPNSVVSRSSNFLNDIVLDYVNGSVGYAYMTDTFDSKLIVFDYVKRISYFFSHKSMLSEEEGRSLTVNGLTMTISVTINGIAMASDFQYVYFTSVANFNTYQIPTSLLRNKSSTAQNFDASLRNIGRRKSQTAGLVYSSKNNMYFASLTTNAVLQWDAGMDAEFAGGFGNVSLRSVRQIARNDVKMVFVDTFGIDEYGDMWFTATKSHEYILNVIDISGKKGTNFHIWRYNLQPGEKSYLYNANRRTRF
ncbi:hypothetical protein ACJMK2_042059 [Sinanodonta woodiana]|uniref:Uncharacterized protein n=1 Tax=Sinanodonta woodiana TaxID=1069815 RepID=A0ABD3W6U8_SINWO